MFTNLSAVQINRLAQRLSEAPLGRSASAAKAADRFQRLLSARIGTERAPKAIKAILSAPGFETAEGRLVAEIETVEPEAAPQVQQRSGELADASAGRTNVVQVFAVPQGFRQVKLVQSRSAPEHQFAAQIVVLRYCADRTRE